MGRLTFQTLGFEFTEKGDTPMTSQRNVLIVEVLLCILIPVTMAAVSHYVYADVYRLTFAVPMLISWAVITLMNWKKEVHTEKPHVRWFTVVLLVAAISVFLVFRPALTYQEGKELLYSNGYSNVTEPAEKSMLSFTLNHTKLVKSAYLYVGEKEGAQYYLLVSPCDGGIEVFTVGEGNYVDLYFDMVQ